VGTKLTSPNGAASALIAAAPPGGSGWEELDRTQAELERGLDLCRRDGTGQGEYAVLLGALDNGAGQARRDHEPGTGGHGLVDLRDGEHRARTDKDVAAGGHRADRVLGGSAKRHLRDRQATGDQRTSQGIGVGRIVEDDDRNEACGAQS